MTEFTLPFFGQISLASLEEYYDVDIELNGDKLQIDLNFETKTLDQNQFDTIKSFIENIEKFDKQNKIYIDINSKNAENSVVRDYLEYHLEEVDADDLATIIDFDNKTTSPENQLLSKLKLVRVGIYPDQKVESSCLAVFDYTISSEISDQLLVVNTNTNGKLDHLTWES
ncbi:MAG: DUF2004 domain-containing protein [Bacteroidota bacterium]